MAQEPAARLSLPFGLLFRFEFFAAPCRPTSSYGMGTRYFLLAPNRRLSLVGRHRLSSARLIPQLRRRTLARGEGAKFAVRASRWRKRKRITRLEIAHTLE